MRCFCCLVIACACALVGDMAVGQETLKPDQVLMVPAQEMAARLLKSQSPKSPRMQKCSRGMVTLDVVIGADGKVRSLKNVAGFKEFKRSAATAVKHWTYKPYLEDGVPTPVETTVQVFYPGVGKPGPLFVPDGNGGVKGGDFLPLPSECAPVPVQPAPQQ